MIDATWELSKYQWCETGADGKILRAETVGQLIFSETEQHARYASRAIADAVGENGWLYPCAFPVAKALLAALPNRSTAAHRNAYK